MQRAAELALIPRMLAHLAAGTTDEAAAPLRIPATHHSNTDHCAVEGRARFRRQLIAVGLASDLPERGSVRSCESGGRPLLLVRDERHRVRAFVNARRHRGAPLFEGEGRLAGLCDAPEADWRLVAHATVQWYRAPNARLLATAGEGNRPERS